MDNLFNENMSFEDAQYTFFKAIDGKDRAEIEKVKAQFEKYIPSITKREMKMANRGWS